MALTLTSLGSTGTATTATTLALTCASAVARDEIIIVGVAIDNTGSAGAAPASLVITDSGSNKYTFINSALSDPNAASAGAYMAVFAAVATTALTTSSTITATSATAAIAMVGQKTNVAADKVPVIRTFNNTNNTSAATTIAHATNSVNVGEAVLCFCALQNGNTTKTFSITADSDTTNGTWSTLIKNQGNVSATAASNMSIAHQNKVQTTTASTQTWNLTFASTTGIATVGVVVTESDPIFGAGSPAIPFIYGFYAGDPLQTPPANGAAVASWRDGGSFGMSTNFVQGTGANQPLMRTTAAPNSKPMVDFDGVNDAISHTIPTTIAQPFSVLVITMPNSPGSTIDCNPISFYIGAGAGFSQSSTAGGASGAATGNWTIWAGTSTNGAPTPDMRGTTLHTITGLFNGASSKIVADGTTYNTAATIGTATAATFVIGGFDGTGSNPWAGKMAAVVFYPGDLSAHPSFSTLTSWITTNYTASGTAWTRTVNDNVGILDPTPTHIHGTRITDNIGVTDLPITTTGTKPYIPAYNFTLAYDGSGYPYAAIPINTKAGDVCYIATSTGTGVTYTTPAGWTKIAGTNPYLTVLRRVLTASDPGTFVGFGISTTFASFGIQLTVVRNAHQTTPENVVGTVNSPGSTTTTTATGPTTTSNDCMGLAYAGTNGGGAASYTVGAPWTELGDYSLTTTTTTQAWQYLTTAGAVSNAAFTATVAGNTASVIVAVAPAAASGTNWTRTVTDTVGLLDPVPTHVHGTGIADAIGILDPVPTHIHGTGLSDVVGLLDLPSRRNDRIISDILRGLDAPNYADTTPGTGGAPTLVSENNTDHSLQSGSTRSLAGVVVQTGDLIIVYGTVEGGNTLAVPTDTASNTYTLRQSKVIASSCFGYLWTAVAASNATVTISTTVQTQGSMQGIQVEVWRNHGGLGNTASNNTSGTGVAAAIALVASGANSAMSCSQSDWNATGAARTGQTVNGSTGTEEFYFRDAGGAHYTTWVRRWDDVGAAGSKTIGTLAIAGGTVFTTTAAEIKAGTGGSGAIQYYRTISDAITTYDTPTPVNTAVSGFTRTINDSIGLLDPVPTHIHGTGIAEAIGITHPVPTHVHGSGVADAIGLLDPTPTHVHGSGVADTVGLLDARALTQKEAVADNVGLLDTATRLGAYIRPQADNIGLLDARALTFKKALADNLGLLDVATRIAAYQRPLADLLGLLDLATPVKATTYQATAGGIVVGTGGAAATISVGAITYQGSSGGVIVGTGGAAVTSIQIRTVNDLVGTTDTSALTQKEALADTIGLLDTRVFTFKKAPADNVGLLDTPTSTRAVALASDEYLGLLDTQTPVKTAGNNYTRTVNDAVGLLDTATPVNTVGAVTLVASAGGAITSTAGAAAGQVIVVTAGGAVADVGGAAATVLALLLRTVTDNVGVLDTATRLVAFARPQTDNVGLLDARTFSLKKALADTLGLLDTSASTLKKALAEAIGVLDAAALTQKEAVADAIGLLDARTLTQRKGLADVLGILDARALIQSEALADTIGVLDLATRIGAFLRPQADTIGLLDTATTIKALLRAVPDVVGLLDTSSRVAAYTRPVIDAVGLLEARLFNQRKALGDNVGILDTPAYIKALTRDSDEYLGLLDTSSTNKILPGATAGGASTTTGGAAAAIVNGPQTYSISAGGIIVGTGGASPIALFKPNAAGPITTVGGAAVSIIHGPAAAGTSTTTGGAAITVTNGATAGGVLPATGGANVGVVFPATAGGTSTTTGGAAATVVVGAQLIQASASGTIVGTGGAAPIALFKPTAGGILAGTGGAAALVTSGPTAGGTVVGTGGAAIRIIHGPVAAGAITATGGAAIRSFLTATASADTLVLGAATIGLREAARAGADLFTAGGGVLSGTTLTYASGAVISFGGAFATIIGSGTTVSFYVADHGVWKPAQVFTALNGQWVEAKAIFSIKDDTWV